jgi:hypothetical protein
MNNEIVPADCFRRDHLSHRGPRWPDLADIVEWLDQFEAIPRRTFLTYGEPPAADALRQQIAEDIAWDADVPPYLEAVDLT